jgi:uncharacterized protein YukE
MVEVDPAELRRYAAQLERNATAFVAPLRDFCGKHCANTAGLTGVLYAARPLVDLAVDRSAWVLNSGEHHLARVAGDLRAAATAYETQDTRAAEAIWASGGRPRPPDGYRPTDDGTHRGHYADVGAPDPAPPPLGNEVGVVVEELRHELAGAKRLADQLHRVAWRFGVDLPDPYDPQIFADWLSGDWDAMRSLASAYGELAGRRGVLVLAANLHYGMDSLSMSWNGPAATAFDFEIRQRWLGAIVALSNAFGAVKEGFEHLAQVSEDLLRLLKLAVMSLKQSLKSLLLRAITELSIVVGGPVGAIVGILAAAAQLIADLAYAVRMATEMLRMSFDSVREALDVAVAELRVVDDIWRRRLTPIVSG